MRHARELADGIAATLHGIPGARIAPFAADTTLPPAIVVQPPTITWQNAERTFQEAQWDWPITIIVPRNRDITAHDALYDLIGHIETRLGDDPTCGGLARWSQLIGAEPAIATINGQDMPAYALTLRMIA